MAEQLLTAAEMREAIDDETSIYYLDAHALRGILADLVNEAPAALSRAVAFQHRVQHQLRTECDRHDLPSRTAARMQQEGHR